MRLLETARRCMEFVNKVVVVCTAVLMTSFFGRMEKRMFSPSKVAHWMIIIYERQQRFNDQVANQMAHDLVKGCEAVGTVARDELAICLPHLDLIIGITINPQPALIKWESGQGNIGQVCRLEV